MKGSARTHVVPGAWLVEYVLYGSTKKIVRRFPTEDKARAFYKSLWKRMCAEQGIRQEQILGWMPEEGGWFSHGPKYVYEIKVRPRDAKDLRRGCDFILNVKGAKLSPARPVFPSLQAAQRYAAGVV